MQYSVNNLFDILGDRRLLAITDGIPVEFAFLPGEANDVRGLNALPLNLPAHTPIYADAAYTNYQVEDSLEQTDAITLQVARKRNSKRPDSPTLAYIKQTLATSLKLFSVALRLNFPNQFMQ